MPRTSTIGRSRLVRLLSLIAPLVLLLLCHCGTEAPVDDNTDDLRLLDTQSTFTTSSPIELMLTLDANPPRVGANTGRIFVSRVSDGVGVANADVSLTVFMPAMGHGSNRTPIIVDEGDGRYTLSRVTFTMPGRWRLTARATFGDESAELVKEYNVR